MKTQLSLAKHTFSRCGSYLVINDNAGDIWNPPGIYLRYVGGAMSQHRRLFRLSLHSPSTGEELKVITELHPEVLHLHAEDKSACASFCIQSDNLLRIQVCGDAVLRLRLDFATGIWQDAYSRVIPVSEEEWDLECFTVSRRIRLQKLSGTVLVDAPWNGRVRSEYMQIEMWGAGDGTEAAMRVFEGPYIPGDNPEVEISFDSATSIVRREFDEWVAKFPETPAYYADAAFAAAYVNWSCVVPPGGHIKKPAILMSKRSMPNVWSWDHCFNAIAHVRSHHDFAWEQFCTPFYNQHESGLLSDFVNSAELNWMCTKPPVHGWALDIMCELNPGILTDSRAEWIYPRLCNWTKYWLNGVNDIAALAGLPHYRHGNDSGWDNATVFASSPCVASPDLTAFLVIQCETLSRLAKRLNLGEEAAVWEQQSETLLNLLITRFRERDRFVAVSACGGAKIATDSLMFYLPLVLGNRLPSEIRKALVTGLREGGFITEFGVCTESLNSALFCRDGYSGYWRGPIWAPPTLMLVLALREIGELKLSQKIARGFCQLCKNGDFAENFDPKTGLGLCDRPYTWTSSVFLLLASNPD